MNLAHVHLLLNHIPVLGVALGLGLYSPRLRLGITHSWPDARWVLFVVSALAAIPTVPHW